MRTPRAALTLSDSTQLDALMRKESQEGELFPPPAAVGDHSARWKQFRRLARKELRESLRDHRTVFTLVLMPILVYPLLGLVIQKFAVDAAAAESTPVATVIFDPSFPGPDIDEILDSPSGYLWPEPDEPPAITDSGPAANSGDAELPLVSGLLDGVGADVPPQQSIRLELLEGTVPPDRIEEAVALGVADVGVRWHPQTRNSETGRVQSAAYEIIHRTGDRLSIQGAEKLERQLRNLREYYSRLALRDAGVGRAWMRHIGATGVEPIGRKQSPLETFVPLMLVLMTMTGAVYPAIDLTAGERERGTLEMLIASPVSRRTLLAAKFFAVFVVAVLTATVNLVATVITVYSGHLNNVIFPEGLTLGMLTQVLALLAVFAAFFSAVLLCVTSFARSFREAQAWLIPLMLVSLAPGILSLLPSVQLTLPLTLVPLVNIVLLGRSLLQGSPSVGLFCCTLASTALYAVIALRFAGRVFGSDAVLFGATGDQTGRWLQRSQTVNAAIPSGS
ncbi:MAG: ABC transporter permease, partial [Planctomycetaceae bacterium]|nr:ABC transporter permease [Planctomycetaceae bacterium]